MEDLNIEYSYDEDSMFSISGGEYAPSITTFSDPGVDFPEEVLSNIREAGFEKPTAVQRHGMPQILGKRDVLCCSYTGSGKTCAYLLPILKLIEEEEREAEGGVGNGCATKSESGSSKASSKEEEASTRPTALILVPTRELALQIKDYTNQFGDGLSLRTIALYGGDNFGMALQRLRKGNIQIVIATPGRLIHLLEEFKVLSLMSVKYLVIDEADEMFNMGFFSQLRIILEDYLPPKDELVNIMFSATFPRQVQYFAKKHLRREYIFIVIGYLGGASPDINQRFYCLTKIEKRMKLFKLVEELETRDKMLVFCNTIDMVQSTASYLGIKEFEVTEIHSQLTQAEREANLSDFNLGRRQVLVATSVAARGLNICNVNYVVNFDLPRDINEFVQRIGRTGRIGVTGFAISFYDPQSDFEVSQDLVTVLKYAHQAVPEFLEEAGDRYMTKEDAKALAVANGEVLPKEIAIPSAVDVCDELWWG